MTSKNSLTSVLLLLAFHSFAFAGEAKPKYIPSTIRLSQKNEFIKKNAAPDYWALSPYYAAQQDGAACGIASTTMLMNAARTHQSLTAADALLTQKMIVEKTKADYSRGLTLVQLSEVIKKAFAAYSMSVAINIVHVDGTPVQNKKIREMLIKNEKTDRNFIIANFNQGIFTGDPDGGGHISPVGAFDEKNNQVLIMDVDREYYEPYWVSFDAFIKGMNTEDKAANANRGFLFVEII